MVDVLVNACFITTSPPCWIPFLGKGNSGLAIDFLYSLDIGERAGGGGQVGRMELVFVEGLP